MQPFILHNVLYNDLCSHQENLFFERTIIINAECPVLRMVVVGGSYTYRSPPLLLPYLSGGQLFKDICTIMGHLGREGTGGVARES